jgi:hypothetical protein
VADDKHGVCLNGSGNPDWQATKDAELKRLRDDYEKNGENSEVIKHMKRVQEIMERRCSR